MFNLTTFNSSTAPVAGTETAYYFLRNALYSTQAIIDSTGAVKERYSYTAYGMPQVLTAAGGTRVGNKYWAATDIYGTRYLFTGRRWSRRVLGRRRV